MESFHKKHGMGKMRVRGTDVYRAGKRIEFFLFIRLTSEGREKGVRRSRSFFTDRVSLFDREREKKSAVDFKREGDEKQLGGKNEARRGFVSFRRKEIRTHARTSIKEESFFLFSFFYHLESARDFL